MLNIIKKILPGIIQETIPETISWCSYTVRISTRAKYMSLKYTAKGLEVIVPIRLHKQHKLVIKFLHHQKDWILKQSHHFKDQLQHQHQQQQGLSKLPIALNLTAIGENWQCIYAHNKNKHIKITPITISNNLLISGPVNHELDINNNHPKINTGYHNLDIDNNHPKISTGYHNLDIDNNHSALNNSYLAIREKITTWLKEKAKQTLIPQLQSLSVQYNLPYNTAIIRPQTTMWGSCNSNKNISLNYKLLFFPAKLAHHVLLHELCHTKHLNHSVRFWRLLTKLDPDCKAHNKLLKTAEVHVPVDL